VRDYTPGLVDNEHPAVRAHLVRVEVLRESSDGDVRGSKTNKLFASDDRIAYRQNRETSIRVDRGIGDIERAVLLRPDIVAQGSDVGRERAIVFEDYLRPVFEEGPVPPAPRPRNYIVGISVDIAGMPVGIGRYTEIAATAVGINTGYYTVVAVFKAGVNGINVSGRGENAIKQISTFLGAEVFGIRCGYLGENAKCTGDGIEEARHDLKTVAARPCQRIVQHSRQIF
jgi:hypothetical protein